MADGGTSSVLPGSKRRTLHWIVAAAFFALFVTGLLIFVPALSGLASGGWTRLVHRVAASLLVAAAAAYALTNRGAAWRWLKQAAVWNMKSTPTSLVQNTWKRTHRTLILIGFILFALTGMIQWFLKGIVPSDVFRLALLFHDIAFLSAVLVLLYHIYFELDWWLWKRRHCRSCRFAFCADVCPTEALIHGPDGNIERDPRRCNGCRLCMESCRRNSYYEEAAQRIQGGRQAT